MEAGAAQSVVDSKPEFDITQVVFCQAVHCVQSRARLRLNCFHQRRGAEELQRLINYKFGEEANYGRARNFGSGQLHMEDSSGKRPRCFMRQSAVYLPASRYRPKEEK